MNDILISPNTFWEQVSNVCSCGEDLIDGVCPECDGDGFWEEEELFDDEDELWICPICGDITLETFDDACEMCGSALERVDVRERCLYRG